MSNKIENENELWDQLSQPITTESKPEPKAKAPKAEKPKAEPVKSEAPKAPKAPETPRESKPARKLDGFFYGCMAGVAAVSVAVTLLVSGMMGGDSTQVPSGNVQNPGSDISASTPVENPDLEAENAELRAQLELQKEQIKNLQNDLMTLMGSEEYLAQAATNPEGGNEVLDAQVKALETLAKVEEAYADFDRARLEELIPEMDEQLSYLTTEALNRYYLILEYVEQPSNDE